MLVLVPTLREARALFDDGRAPRSEDPEDLELGGRPVRAALCGFGPAAAGALAAIGLARERPRRCLLLGVCGSYDLERLPVGALVAPDRVVFGDLGVDRGGGWQGPRALGLEQAPTAPGRPGVVEGLDLVPPPGTEGLARGLLVSVARGSGAPGEARTLSLRHPGALAEDMEGFGVALACARLRIEFGVVRAVANAAGEPDRALWDLPGALAALRAWLLGVRL